MYLPEHFRQDDAEAIQGLIAAYPLAALITQANGELEGNHYPFLYLPGDGGAADRLIGHLSKANQQWKTYQDGTPALAIFQGPDSYVSPNWYPSKHEHGRAVPTWNYAAVHMHGTLTIHQDAEWLRDVVTRLTDHHEAKQAETRGGEPWRVTDAPPQFVDGLLKAIVGLELRITKIEAKWKVSQNRSVEDRRQVASILDTGGAAEKAMAELIRVNIS